MSVAISITKALCPEHPKGQKHSLQAREDVQEYGLFILTSQIVKTFLSNLKAASAYPSICRVRHGRVSRGK